MDIRKPAGEKEQIKWWSWPAALTGTALGLSLSLAFWAGHFFGIRNTRVIEPVSYNVKEEKWGQTTPAPIVGRIPFAGVSPNLISDVAAASMPSVVNIDAAIGVGTVQPNSYFSQQPEEGFRVLPPAHPAIEGYGMGSGVIYNSDGYILTNYHVVYNASKIMVTLNDGRRFPAKVIGRDRFTDLAVIKIEAGGLKTARFGDSATVRPGDWAIAIGSALGLSNTVTFGIVSAIDRAVGRMNQAPMIQTDAAINRGNSGGPLINIKGEVVGINSCVRRDGQNVSFAVPINTAKDVAYQLIRQQAIRRPYIGVAMQTLHSDNVPTGASSRLKGVLIDSVEPGGPAEDAGLHAGDIIITVEKRAVLASKDVQQAIRKHSPGESILIGVWRSGQILHLNVKIGEFEGD